MKTTIIAENIIKCGCSNVIHKALASARGVYGVTVYPEHNEIVIDHTEETNTEEIIGILTDKGYRIVKKDNPPDYCNENH